MESYEARGSSGVVFRFHHGETKCNECKLNDQIVRLKDEIDRLKEELQELRIQLTQSEQLQKLSAEKEKEYREAYELVMKRFVDLASEQLMMEQ